MKQMILKIDEEADFSLMPDLLKQAIAEGNIQWPQSQMVSTKSYYGKKLILVLTSLSKDTLNQWLTIGYPCMINKVEKIVDFKLNWKILAVEGEVVDQSKILPFMVDLPRFNEQGEIIGYEEVVDLTGKLQTFSGREWTYA